MSHFEAFFLTFIPILVAINIPGVLPIYISISEPLIKSQKRKIATQSVITAFVVSVGFVFLGQAIFNALRIQVEDFMIGGGVLLLVISIIEIVAGRPKSDQHGAEFGAVPLGTPLLAGPATLTTALILAGSYGYLPVILSLMLVLFLAWLSFTWAEFIIRIIGHSGARAMAKVAYLFLAAIAVHLIKSGIFKVIGVK
ncbi:MAG TPA: MarC family protein [Dissulfurispiraceae bacterium]|nr:MarC family protein [Dissulfurispiraceae bacterium]